MGTIIRNVKHQKENRKHQSPPHKTQTQATALFSKSMRGTSAKKTAFFRALVATLALKRHRASVFAMMV